MTDLELWNISEIEKNPMDKPVWLLDIDGVLNAFHHQSGYHKTDVYVPSMGQSFTIRWSPEIIRRIVDISERVRIVWCTTWQHEARTELAPALELPDFPAFSILGWDLSVGPTWWKYKAYLSTVMSFRTIWTDDDISELLIKDNPNTSDSLIIRPHPNRGLTMKHLDQIEEWI